VALVLKDDVLVAHLLLALDAGMGPFGSAPTPIVKRRSDGHEGRIGNPRQEVSMEPFRIDVPDGVLADLKERLGRTRYPDEIEGSGWDYGTDLSYLRELVQYWRDGFDWRAAEAALNRLPHFRTDVDDLGIHFIHARSPVEDAFPLLITHGWPGSVFEFAKIIGPLTDPVAHGGRAEDAFHVVCPSMPGYGFSDT